MKIEKIEVHTAKIPLALQFSHSLNKSRFVESIFVKATLDNGIFGFGECVPRDYVSGETVLSEEHDIEANAPYFKNLSFGNEKELTKALRDVKSFGTGQCALELALLDAGGKYFKKTVPDLLERKIVKKEIIYSDGIPIGSDIVIKKFADLVKKFQLCHVKVKVGRGDDLKRLKKVREIFGPKMIISIDVNTVWAVDQAIEMIKKMEKYDIEMVEQPVKDIDELSKVRRAVNVPIMADESLTTVESAQELINHQACQIFNIRISKHGGLFNSLKIYDLAKKNGVKCLLGCHIGETDILAAAGRHFASIAPDLLYVAGSGEKFLFKDNLIEEDLTFGKGGSAKLIPGYGLGIHPNEKLLKKYYTHTIVI